MHRQSKHLKQQVSPPLAALRLQRGGLTKREPAYCGVKGLEELRMQPHVKASLMKQYYQDPS